jgi:hypothetical protein
MIRRLADRGSHIGMVITGPEDEEDDNIKYCENCYKVGELNALKERIFLDSAGKLLPTPPDNDDFMMCRTC